MDESQPLVVSADGRRRFFCSPVAVLGFIVNESLQTLLLSHPARHGRWEVVNGAMEAEETVLQAVLRETREELGDDLWVRPLGTVHVSTFDYDEHVVNMLSVGYLLAYEGGNPKPGDDMSGSEFRWWGLDELASPKVELLIPPGEKWLVERAVSLYRQWNHKFNTLPPGFERSEGGNKHA